MKKLIFVLALMFTYVISEAQIATLNIAEPNTYVEYSTDVTLTNTTAKYFLINAGQDQYTAQAYTVNLDSLTGNHTKIAVVLAGQYSDVESTWTTISTTNWGCTTLDTTMTVVNATENGYRRFKVTFTGTGTGTSKIDNFEFKQYLGLP
jgi:hypothetical protein